MMKRDLQIEAVEKVDAFLQQLLLVADLRLSYCLSLDDAGEISAQFDGVDAGLLTERDGELLFALQHLTTEVLRQRVKLTFQLDHEAGLPSSWNAAP